MKTLEVDLTFRARHRNQAVTRPFANRTIRLLGRDYRKNHYGSLLDTSNTSVAHRKQIYGSGPSLMEGSAECLDLICRHLGPPPCKVVDIGCGLGYYGRQLLARGYDWIGAEIKPEDCANLERQGLPFRRIDGITLPFADGDFDCAICIEVMEHVRDLSAFLAEARRVTRRLMLVSVPNAELIPYMQDHLAVPWHLLEADHHNFFTRTSLRATLQEHFATVEVLHHTRHPLATSDGLPLFYHLFAVASA